MRDVSPSEQAVLERAASFGSVYLRPTKSKKKDNNLNIPLNLGCFACSHKLGPLNPANGFFTVQIVSLDNEYYNNMNDPSAWNWFSFVSEYRAFLTEDDVENWTWRATVREASRGIQWMKARSIYGIDVGHLRSYPEIPVFLYSRNGKQINHIGSAKPTKINLIEKWLSTLQLPSSTTVRITLSPSTMNSVYYDPCVPMVMSPDQELEEEAEDGDFFFLKPEGVRVSGRGTLRVIQERTEGLAMGLDAIKVLPKRKPTEKKVTKAKLTYEQMVAETLTSATWNASWNSSSASGFVSSNEI